MNKSMSTLCEIQNNFQNYLTSNQITSILPQIAPDSRFDATKRLKVYFDSYRIRLLEILKLDFPKTHTLLGDESFEMASLKYLEKHPSHHFSVRYFGQHFSQFLATEPPFRDCPVLAEMAQFEWNLAYTVDAKNAPLITQDQLKNIMPEQWPNIVFEFHPSVTSNEFKWNTPKLWQLIESEAEPQPPEQLAIAQRWLFWRKDIRSYFLSCNEHENIIYNALQKKQNFAQICDQLFNTVEEQLIPSIVATTLMKWINEKMFSHFEILS